MKVKILIEFEVEWEKGGDDLMPEQAAKEVAQQAAFNHLCLTNNGQDVTDKPVESFMDGEGMCLVTLVEDD